MAGNPSFSQSLAVIDLSNGKQAGSGAFRQVLVTPVSTGLTHPAVPQTVVNRPNRPAPIDKVFLKAVSKANAKEVKTFTLRHINTTRVSNSDELKKLIKQQLGSDVKDWENFDVGYVQGTCDRVITIRSRKD